MFGRIRNWFNRRKAKKAVSECIAYAERPIDSRAVKPKGVRTIEGDEAHIMSLLLKGCPHLIIVQNGRELATSIRLLSYEAFREAIFEMAKREDFRDLLTDIVIDINTDRK